MIQKNYRLEIKSAADDGSFDGYASVFGNVDFDGDVIDKGAFKRTIDHSKGVVPILWQHDRTQPVGWNASAEEDGFGLKVSGRLMVDTEIGRTALSFLKTGLELGGKPGLSIGFMVPKGGDYVKDGVRHFKEVALKEYSIVTFPANEKATALSAKEAKTKRVAGEDLPASAFAYVGDPADTSTWKLPIHFSTPEKSASHIRNALARFNQTQGIPESERATVLAKIKRAAKEHGIDAGEGKREKDFNDSLAEARTMSALYQERNELECALYDAIQDTLSDDSMSANEKKSDIADSLNQHAAAMADWYGRLIDADTDDDTEEDLDEMGKQEKSGRMISAATAEKIKMAMDHIQKGLGHLEDLSKQPYTANDVNADNPVGGGKSENTGDPEEKILHSLLELTRSVADQTKA